MVHRVLTIHPSRRSHSPFSLSVCSKVDEGAQEIPLSPARPQGLHRPHSRQDSVDSSKFTRRKPVNTLSTTSTATPVTSSTTNLPYAGSNNASNVSIGMCCYHTLLMYKRVHLRVLIEICGCLAWNKQRLTDSHLLCLSLISLVHNPQKNNSRISKESTGNHWGHEPI